MKEGYKEITLLQQREIEARVLAPLIRAFCSEFGEERGAGRSAARDTGLWRARQAGPRPPHTAAGSNL